MLPLAEKRLSDIISTSLDTSDRVTIFRQTTEAVKYIHDKGFMHRDIKSANILLEQSSPPLIRLVDFGSATKNPYSYNHMAGTIRYLAPEVIALKLKKSSDSYDKAVDIWSLGLVAYELLCRELVLFDRITLEVLDRLRAQVTSTASVPTHIGQLINRMLQWSAVHRLSAAELLQSLETIQKRVDDGRHFSVKHAREE
jgi:serine/threonine protein kinase